MGASQQLGVRIGFAGGTVLSSIDQVRADVVWACEAGFNSYWLSYAAGIDPLVALPVVARDAAGIELGTSVVPMVGRHPIAMAQLARSAQQACGGGFTLGIGPSHQVVVESMYGEVWDRPVERTDEYLRVLVPLCDGEPASFTGRQISGHTALNIAGAPVPVVLAALGQKMLELAGRLTTGTHVGQCGPKTIATHTAPIITAAAEQAGRPAPRIIALVNLCVTDEPRAVRAAAAPGAANYAALPSYRAMLDREGVDDPTDLILAGSMTEIADELGRYAEAGVTDLRLGIAARHDADREHTRTALAEWLS